jgi:hypothetical protein
MRITVLWQFVRPWRFKGNEDYKVQSVAIGVITDQAKVTPVTVLVEAAITFISKFVGLDYKHSVV